ncbi:MAG: hypothetical protein RLZZ54_2629 [Cyanobacteriota bacterium]|jgi:hypothetical protein
MAALVAGVGMAEVAAVALGLTLVIFWIPAATTGTDICTKARAEMVGMEGTEAEVAMVAMAGLAYLALP